MKPDVSHDFVKDFTLKIAETNLTVESTSLSRPLKIWPNTDLSSAACRNVIRATTTASWNKGNLTRLRMGAASSLIRPMVAPGNGRGGAGTILRRALHARERCHVHCDLGRSVAIAT